MGGTSQAQSLYYQTIAREFFRLRGAPFYLSPKDVELIGRWEKRRVPLDAVLEGMTRAFENFRKGRRPAKALTLASCEYQVMKTSAQDIDRKAGSAWKPVARKSKQQRLQREIANFLANAPDSLRELRSIFEKALGFLRLPKTDEEALEALDGEVDKVLWQGVSAEVKEEARREAALEFSGKRGVDLQEATKIKLMKTLRDKYKVPYLGLFYY